MTEREKLIEMLIESGNIGRRRNHDKSQNKVNDNFAAIVALYLLVADAERVLKEREQCSTKD